MKTVKVFSNENNDKAFLGEIHISKIFDIGNGNYVLYTDYSSHDKFKQMQALSLGMDDKFYLVRISLKEKDEVRLEVTEEK